jgi:tight adherence protein C
MESSCDDMMPNLIIAGLAILVFGVSALLLVTFLLRPGKEAQRTLDIVLTSNPETPLVTRRERFLDGILAIVQDVRNRLGLTPSAKAVEKLAAAGFRKASAPDFYFAAQVLLPIACAWAGSLVRDNTVFWVFICGTVGFFIPEFWLTEAERRRRHKIRRSLPDTIDLLVICVDAGLGLDQAVLRVSEEITHSHPEFQEELHRMRLEQKAGRPRMETWQNLSARVKLPELTSLVSLLTQADRSGGQITKALSNFADDLRLRQRQRVEEAVAETRIKIIFPLVFFIFPCLFIVLLGPALLNITHDLTNIIR